MDVLRQFFFDFPCYQLLDTLGALTRPRRDYGYLAHRYIWIFSLGHTSISPNAPSENCDKKNPGNVPVLHEIARDVVPPRRHISRRSQVASYIWSVLFNFAHDIARPEQVCSRHDDSLARLEPFRNQNCASR